MFTVCQYSDAGRVAPGLVHVWLLLRFYNPCPFLDGVQSPETGESPSRDDPLLRSRRDTPIHQQETTHEHLRQLPPLAADHPMILTTPAGCLLYEDSPPRPDTTRSRAPGPPAAHSPRPPAASGHREARDRDVTFSLPSRADDFDPDPERYTEKQR